MQPKSVARVAVPMAVASILAAPAPGRAATDEAPIKLFTPQGVEIRLDERVFELFAALNAAGYSKESKRRGPPLNAPVYHPLRVEVRDALRELRDEPIVDELRDLFASNPQPVAVYLAALMAEEGDRISEAAQALKPKLGPIEEFAEDASLQALFDRLATEQRDLAKTLMKAINEDLAAVRDMVDSDFRAPIDTIIVPNPLDSHAALEVVEVGPKRFVVVGPDFEEARQNLIVELSKPYLRSAVEQAWGAASKYRSHWDQVKISRRISGRYRNGKNYLTVALAQALAHEVDADRKGEAGREADEEFIDEHAREGLRWARVALRLWEQHEDGKPFEKDLPQLVAKYGP